MQNEMAHEEILAEMLHELPVMTWRTGSNNSPVYFNKSWLQFIGHTLEHALENDWVENIHPDDRQSCTQSYHNACHTRKPFKLDCRVQRHDTEYRWLKISGKPVIDGAGTFTGYMCCAIDITEQRSLETQVQNYREGLRRFTENTPMPMYCIDMDGKIVSANKQFRTLTGYSEWELMNKPVNEVHSDQLLMWELFTRMLSGHSVRDHLTSIRCKNGKEKKVMITASNLWEDGKYMHACCYVQELNGESSNEKEIKHLNKLLSSVIFAGRMMSSTLELGKLVQFIVNAAITASEAEFGSFFYSVSAGASFPTEGHTMAGPIATRKTRIETPSSWTAASSYCISDVSRSRTWKNKKLDGIPAGMKARSYAIVPLQVTGYIKGCIYLAHSEPQVFTSYTANVLKGVSMLASITLENARLFEAMRTEERKFRTLAESIPQMIWTSTSAGRIDYCNLRLEEYTGLTLSDISVAGLAQMIHSEDVKSSESRWTEAIENGTAYEVECRIKKASDSSYRWHLVRALPLRDNAGNIIKWFGSCTDIDDQKKLDEQKDNFMAIASHELKTPLTTIKAYLQLLGQVNSDNHKTMLYIGKAADCTNKLNNLVSDLLDVTRIQGGKMQYKTSDFDIMSLVNDCSDNLQNTITTHRIEKTEGVNALIKADKQRLEQVVSNLLLNAIKYSPGKTKVSITTSRVDDEHIQVSITDYGIGIAEQHQAKLFQRFYRVEAAADRFAGLGIGLYISSEIVKHHRGAIGVRSKDGEGSTFYFTLPVKQWLE
jgi:PAS domain S-box-containing protein